jgi:phosphate starvation-inducible protein PhoH
LKDVPGVAEIAFGNDDIVRHALVGRIVAAYDRKTAKPKK